MVELIDNCLQDEALERQPSNEADPAAAQTTSPSPRYPLDSQPPEKDTAFAEAAEGLPEHVLSRQGTPDRWDFDERGEGAKGAGSTAASGGAAGLRAAPPRPTSATLCSPPVPRKVPVSVDHHLRK